MPPLLGVCIKIVSISLPLIFEIDGYKSCPLPMRSAVMANLLGLMPDLLKLVERNDSEQFFYKIQVFPVW